MDFIIDVLIDFFKTLGLPYRTINMFFKDYKSIYYAAKELSNSDLQKIIEHTNLAAEMERKKNDYSYLLFIPKRNLKDKIGWNVVGLNKFMKNKFEFSLFCDSTESLMDFNNVLRYEAEIK